MNETLCQILIGTLGLISVYLTATKRPNEACIFGLCAQPAWFYTTYHHEQWGIFFLAFAYTFMWCLGIYNYWIKEAR